jgi:hypothetical protein
MFNRQLDLWERFSGAAGEVRQELADRAAYRRSAYRPARYPIKKKAHGQLEMFHVEPFEVLANVVRDPERPLADLIPEAYQ